LQRPRRGLDLTGLADERFEARFWSKVDRSGECWTWGAFCKPNGYGQFTVRRGVFFGAHCVSYALAHGPIPAGMVVCHRCDNPPCVRPDHLFLGTQVDNALDMLAKKRASRARGVDHPFARLAEADVRAIRSTPPYWGRVRDLAFAYGVSTHAVRQILLGRTWRHVSVEPTQLSLFEVGEVA
jgi:hypothetical protein